MRESMLNHTVQTNKHIVDSALEKMVKLDVPTLNDNEIALPIMKKREAEVILATYQETYAPRQSPIVASLQGKPSESSIHPKYPSRQQLYASCRMKPRSSAQFRVKFGELTLDEIILILIHPESTEFLCPESRKNLRAINKKYSRLFDEAKRLQTVDFSKLRAPRLNYANQKCISKDRVDMASACFLHYKGEPGLVVRYLDGEYTGAHRDITNCLKRIETHVNQEDYDAIERILTSGCPRYFDVEIPKSEKTKWIERGNQQSVNDNLPLVQKTMNKEDASSHIIPIMDFLVHFSAYCHHVPQGLNRKQEKDRIIWDGSTRYTPEDFVINRASPVDSEPKITFGQTKNKVCQYAYNVRAEYKNQEVLIGYVDIKACFRYPRFSPEVAGAFGYLMESMGHYCLSNAGVFGWIGSAAVWEPFRRAIEKMTEVIYDELEDGQDIHKELIDKISWAEPPPPGTVFTKAVKDALNPGVTDAKGKQLAIPSFFFVDDGILIAVWHKMRRLLNAVIEAIFVVLGRRDDLVRHCHLALDKWYKLHISPKNTFIGLTFDMRALTVGVTDKYRDELKTLIDAPWHSAKRSFTANELEILVGKIARIGEACPWIYHLLPHLYASITHALGENKKHYQAFSPSFRTLLDAIKRARKIDIDDANFNLRIAARRIHKSNKRYFINATLADEIAHIRDILETVDLQTPIAHMIPRVRTAEQASDACIYGGGGYCLFYKYWFHVEWPEDIFKRTKKFVNKGKDLIDINVLEFAAMILNYAAALTALEHDGLGDDPHPTLLAFADNQSAVRWITKFCLTSLAGRALGRLFCGLLVDSPLGINAKWLAGVDNTIADAISRLKKQNIDDEGYSNFDFSSLPQRFPQLRGCRRFVPSTELFLCLQRAVLTKKSPTLSELRQLKRRGLGRLIGSDTVC